MMTPEQNKLMKEAIAEGNTLPKMTNDPVVNYEIDRLITANEEEDSMPPWDEAHPNVRRIYLDEVQIFKTENIKNVSKADRTSTCCATEEECIA